MADGIRATVAFETEPPCPIASASREAGCVVDRVWTSVVPPGTRGSVSEFVLHAEAPPAAEGVEHVMSIDDRHVLRFEHGDGDCPCACIGRFGCPVQRYVADDGGLRLVFNAAGYDELQAVVAALRDRFRDLEVERLLRSPDAGDAADAVTVDRSRLTTRQHQVLRTAHGMGYFERPRRANATEVAAELDVDPSTFAEHLAAAQRKLLGDVLEG